MAGKPGKTDEELEQQAMDYAIGVIARMMRLNDLSELRIWFNPDSGLTYKFTEKAKLDAEVAQARQELAAMGAKPVFEVGAPYILNYDEAPHANQIVICTHPDGRCRYLCIRNNRRWPHVMQLTERSTSLAQFGVAITMPAAFVLMLEQVADSQAVYSDHRPRLWQDISKSRLPMHPNNPKYWRMDDRYTLPLLIKWVEKYPTAQAQFERILRPWTCDACQTSTVEGVA